MVKGLVVEGQQLVTECWGVMGSVNVKCGGLDAWVGVWVGSGVMLVQQSGQLTVCAECGLEVGVWAGCGWGGGE